MKSKRKKFADSKEWGLVFLSRLTGLDYLHYGLWPSGLAVTVRNIAQAQENYAQMLLRCIAKERQKANTTGGTPHVPPAPLRILDVGCGTGGLFIKMVQLGYIVDGVVPSQDMYEEAQKNWMHAVNMETDAQKEKQDLVIDCNENESVFSLDSSSRLICSPMEDLDEAEYAGKYDIVLFSESFQYVLLERAIDLSKKLMAANGKIIICDFFQIRSEMDRSHFGGGHPLHEFYDLVKKEKLIICQDEDLTELISPTIALLETILKEHIVPATESLVIFFCSRYRILSWIFSLLFRKDLGKIRQKYLSGHRTRQVFETYKSYRLIELQKS